MLRLSRLWQWKNRKDRFPKSTRQSFDLDTPLLDLAGDAFTIRDSVEGIQIFGSIGSGKTSSSGATLARAMLRAGFGGVILCAKPEEFSTWERYCAETGRSHHLFRFAPDEQWRFNFLDYELNQSEGGHTENLVQLFRNLSEIVENTPNMQGKEDFWDRSMLTLLRNTIQILRLSGEDMTLKNIASVIASAPQSLEQINSKIWRKSSLCASCFFTISQMAEDNQFTVQDKHDAAMATHYWTHHFPTLADRTRSSIVATFISIADQLLHGDAYQLMCTTSTILPDSTYIDGAIIALDLPIQRFHDVGRICQSIFKYHWQRAILKRDITQFPRPVFLFADESQNFISSFDYEYQAVARSARAATIYISQSISNYNAKLRNKDTVHAFLGNLNTKLFHSNTDYPTCIYASEIIGKQFASAFSHTMNMNPQHDGSRSSTTSKQLHYKVQPSHYATLRKGGKHNNYECDAILMQGGRIFTQTNDTYLPIIFKQREN